MASRTPFRFPWAILALPLLSLPLWVWAFSRSTQEKGQVAYAVTLALTLLSLVLFHVVMLRRFLVVARLSGRVCLCCGYDLTGLDDRGECPECGSAYDIARPFLARWREARAKR